MEAEFTTENSELEEILPPSEKKLEFIGEESPPSHKESRKSGPGRVYCQFFLFAAFVLLFISTAYLSYKSFQYKHELKKCSTMHAEILASKPHAMPHQRNKNFIEKLNEYSTNKNIFNDEHNMMPRPHPNVHKNIHDLVEDKEMNGDKRGPVIDDEELMQTVEQTTVKEEQMGVEPQQNEEEQLDDKELEEGKKIGDKVEQEAAETPRKWQKIAHCLKKCIVIKDLHHGKEATIDAQCLETTLRRKMRSLKNLRPSNAGNLLPFSPFRSH